MIEYRKRTWTKSSWLIALCWLAYTCSYIGKLSYSANINQIEKVYGISHSEAGLVSTFFFFAYGAGQIVNGLLCKKYNVRYVVFGSLFIGGLANLVVAFAPTFSIVKYVWLVNGAAMSVLWSSMIRLLSESLDKKGVASAILAMGTTVATGTFVVYGLSALLVAVASYRIVFIIAGVLLPVVALTWVYFEPRLIPEKEESSEGENNVENVKKVQAETQKGFTGLWGMLGVLAFFGIADNLVKDGLTTWTPSILDALYALPGWLSIFLTLLLPLLGIFGNVLARRLDKVLKNSVAVCMLLFFGAGALIGLILGLLSTNALVVTIVCFSLVTFFMSSVNSMITSIVPFSLKERGNSGMVAGLLNAFCYLGSTISSFGLGSVAEVWGWSAVFILLLCVCGVMVLTGGIYLIVKKSKERKVK
ncbi:MAG: MFS transporter [Clostridia bacterium]|nr:MFS transporter [Clostridia bacterium]